MCVPVSVFLHDNSKRNRSRNIKFKRVLVYENSSNMFDIGHCHTKVKVTAGLRNFSSFTAIQTASSFTLVQARKLILSVYFHLILIFKIYEYHHT